MKAPGEPIRDLQIDRVLERAEPTAKFAVALLGKDRLVTLKCLDQRQHCGPDRRHRDDRSSPPFAESLAPIVPPPAWSLALHELDMTLDALAVDDVSRMPARLTFRVRHAGRRFEGIDVLLQRSLRGGRFSQDQLADPDELLAAAEMLSDSEDTAAVVVLTDGVPQAPRTRPAPSRARLLPYRTAPVTFNARTMPMQLVAHRNDTAAAGTSLDRGAAGMLLAIVDICGDRSAALHARRVALLKVHRYILSVVDARLVDGDDYFSRDGEGLIGCWLPAAA